MIAMNKTKKKFVVRPSRLAACTSLSGDVVAGQLLYRIFQRQETMKALKDKDDGRKCIVLTRPEWMIDTGLSRHQYDRGLRILKCKKLVEVRHKKLRKSDKHLRTRIYLHEDTISAIADLMKCEGKSEEAETVVNLISGKPDTSVTVLSAAPDDIVNVKLKEENDELMENDFFEKKSEEGKQEKVKKKDNEGCIYKISEEKVVELIPVLYKYCGTAHPALTKSLIAAAKTCIDRLEEDGCEAVFLDTPLDADDDHPVFTTRGIRAMALTMLCWHEFCVFIKIANGAWNIPLRPCLHYMRLHVDGLVDYIRFKKWLYETSEGNSEKYFNVENGLNQNKEIVESFYNAPPLYMLNVDI